MSEAIAVLNAAKLGVSKRTRDTSNGARFADRQIYMHLPRIR
ncbi:unnamed protein product [Schistosoma curassoni]|uniref:Transposase n=1 Tax=Schistosoma curassoni TaxID=6186 RepID=A0A183L6N0_9TREM|nr:unnamed protein product [Schistosoma curassoni]